MADPCHLLTNDAAVDHIRVRAAATFLQLPVRRLVFVTVCADSRRRSARKNIQIVVHIRDQTTTREHKQEAETVEVQVQGLAGRHASRCSVQVLEYLQ